MFPPHRKHHCKFPSLFLTIFKHLMNLAKDQYSVQGGQYSTCLVIGLPFLYVHCKMQCSHSQSGSLTRASIFGSPPMASVTHNLNVFVEVCFVGANYTLTYFLQLTQKLGLPLVDQNSSGLDPVSHHYYDRVWPRQIPISELFKLCFTKWLAVMCDLTLITCPGV